MTRYATPALGCLAAVVVTAAVAAAADPAVMTLVGAGSAAAVLIGMRRRRAVRPALHDGRLDPWLLLALGLLVLGVSDGLRVAAAGSAVLDGFPGGAEAGFAAAVAVLGGGLLSLVRDRFPGHAVECLLEAGLVSGVVSLLLWVSGKAVYGGDVAFAQEAGAAVLISGSVLMLWLAVSSALLAAERPPWQGRLVAGVGCVAGVHTALGLAVLGAPAPPRAAMVAVVTAGYVLWASAALHPSTTAFSEPVAPGPARLRRRQVAVLGAVGLVGPALLVVAGVADVELDLPVVAAVLAALSLLGVVYLARLVQARERVEWRAHHDELTGLPNRAVYNDRLARALAHARRSGGALAVMFLDLDRFKAVNDTLGHAEGNRLLQAASKRLQQCLRDDDTIARFGGDEFAVLLPEIEGVADAVTVAEKLLGAFEQPFEIADRPLFISTSIGVALFPSDGVEADQLVRNADAAMYRAKERGRNAYHLYSREINARVKERLSLEAALHGAIERRELVLHYQPKIEVVSGRMIGVEALVRWRHPERGLIGPDEFIPVAEEAGLIGDLGEWVLEEACRQARQWQRDGLPSLTVGVNVSTRQFRDQRVADVVARVLRGTGLAPSFLELELTESLAMETTEQTMEALHDLRQMGVQCSMDDFGTGYSSLSYLTRLPIERLKIDNSLVARIGPGDDGDDAAIVRAVIVLAHSLGLQVVAEGVETPDQLAFLQRHGCDHMQGFLFSKPVPHEGLGRMLREQQARAGVADVVVPAAALDLAVAGD